MRILNRRVVVVLAVVVAIVVGLVLWPRHPPASRAVASAPVAVTQAGPTAVSVAAQADASVVIDEPVPPPVSPPAASLRAPVAVATTPVAARGLRLQTIDGFKLVRIGGGDAATRPYGGPDNSPTQTLTGRVVDRSGHPVAGAVVLADDDFHLMRETLMARGGAVTGADGSFTIDTAPRADCAVVALFGREWSRIVRVSKQPLELVIAGHGTLEGRFTYNGGPERFALTFESNDKLLSGHYDTADDGTTTVASLPPGTYSATAGLAQALGGGASADETRTVTIVDGETASLAIDFDAGATIAVTAVVPADVPYKGLTFWLFSREPPRDVAEARSRRTRENTPSTTLSAGLAGSPMQFHDVAAGTYWACAALFDVKTFDAADGPFGCTRAVVGEDAAVVEVSVSLSSR